MRVALVHDYLNEFGGAERVLLALSEIFPEAPIYTIYAKKGSVAHEHFKDKEIRESWFARLPFADKLISPLRFLVPFIWSSFDFSEYDLVVTSASWAVTKGIKKGKKTKEICYLHSPPRYLYGYDSSRDWQNRWFGGLVKLYSVVVNHFMRQYDFRQAQKVDYFVVNSKNIGKRVEKFYRRTDYKVIYPPVNLRPYHKKSLFRGLASLPASRSFLGTDSYYLTGGRLVAAKNFDLIIKACRQANVRLKVYGDGVDAEKLRKLCGNKCEMLGRVSEEEMVKLYAGAKAFIVAQRDEDFGITPIEAAAAGCPTIAYKGGGYLESVVEGNWSDAEAGTGLFFDELSEDSIAGAIKKFEKKKFNKKVLQNHAEKFSEERFMREFEGFVGSKVK